MRPVRPVRAPLLRAAGWLCAVSGIGLVLAMMAEPARAGLRLAASADIAWSVAGAVLTAICAALAAFMTAMPDRARAWALLPLPPLVLWVVASGVGCLRDEAVTVAGTHVAGLGEVRRCVLFILGMSIPLSVVAVAMLRRAYPLRPQLTATLAGLAASASAASLLTLFHPYDATAVDFGAHVVAVAMVVVGNRVWAGRALRPR